jgi:hypothetical protein
MKNNHLFGIISARMHLWSARRNHRKLFSKGLINISHIDCKRVNDDIGIALKKLSRLGIKGRCGDYRSKNASLAVKSLYLQKVKR